MKSILCSFITAALILTMSVGGNHETLFVAEPADDASVATFSKQLPNGYVEHVASFAGGGSPEGITVDKRGNLYVGVRTKGSGTVSEIVRIGKDGVKTHFASLPASGPGTSGVLGLVTDPPGNVYAAFVSDDPATQGVYRISKDGVTIERLAGSGQITLPNALTFDDDGNLYVTDSDAGKIWRYDPNGSFTEWLQHTLLEPVETGAPEPVPGANGIAFYPPNKLYVANTSQFSITRVLIGPGGTAMSVESVAAGFLLVFVDGIAVDVHEQIYGVLATANAEEVGAPSVAGLVKVDPQTGLITPVLLETSDFDAPLSLAFGTGGPWSRKSVFITNSARFGPVTNGPGAGVIRVHVGTPGEPGH
jgi:sugar lactone lactonase YvrE